MKAKRRIATSKQMRANVSAHKLDAIVSHFQMIATQLLRVNSMYRSRA